MDFRHCCILAVALTAALAVSSVLAGDHVAQLSSADSKVRGQAACALGRAGKVSAVPHLIRLLTDYPKEEKPRYHPPYGTPSSEAHAALVRIGKKAVPQLVKALEGENPIIVVRVCCILGLIGDERAVNPILPLLNAREHEVRAQAAFALGRMSRHLDSLDPIVRAFSDPHPLVTGFAVEGLGFSGDVRAQEPLLAILRNQEHRNRADACMSLARLKCQKAVPLLLPLLEGPGYSPRRSAIYALGELGDPQAVKPLIHVLETKGLYEGVYVGCVRALIKLHTPEALAAVTAVFDREEAFFPVTAVDELAKLGREAESYLAKALCAKNPKVQEAAIRGFKRLYGPRFDEGGKEWYVWLGEQLRKQGPLPALAGVQSVPARPADRMKLLRAREFKIEGQARTSQFLVAHGRLIASLMRFDAQPAGAHVDRDRARGRVSHVLVAWDLKGNLLWQADYPRPYRICMAGGTLALAFDDGTADANRGMIWIDPADGKELQRINLPGRPASLTFNLTSETVMMVIYPQHRMRTLKGAWMEVRSYRLSGELAWMRKEQVTELRGLSLDGPVVVIGSRCAGKDFLAGLDAMTGKELWRRRWGYFPRVPEAGTVTPQDMTGLTMVPGSQGVEFIEARSGKTVTTVPVSFGVAKRTAHKDRLHFTALRLEGFTMGACAWPSGKPIWADKTNTVSYGQPVAWGENVVFLARRLSNGLTGHVTLTELRVYGPRGDLRCYSAREKAHWEDTATPVADGAYLYLVDHGMVVALQMEQEK